MSKGWLLIFLIAMAAFQSNNQASADAAARTIVALGDSTTAGHPDFQSPAEHPPEGAGNPESQYAFWIRKAHPEWKVVNRGISGERADEILGRFESDVLAYRPDVVIVIGGVNDLHQGYPAERVKSFLQRIYEKAAQNGIRVMTGTILPYDTASGEGRKQMGLVNEWIKKYAQSHSLGFCDTFTLLQDAENPGKLISTADGLHPDARAYRVMGEGILKCLEVQFFSR